MPVKFTCARTQHFLLILRPWVLVRPGFKLLTSRSADCRSPNWADLVLAKNNNSEELNHIFYHNQALLLLHMFTYDNWYRYKTTFVQTYFPFIFRFHGPILKYFLSKSGQLLICFSPPCRQAFSRTLQISQNSTASLHRSRYPAGNTGLSADIFSWMGGNGNENNKYLNNQTTIKSFMLRGMTLKSNYVQLEVFCVPERLCKSF